MIKLVYLTLFPDYFRNYFQISIAKRALESRLIGFEAYNLRDYAEKKQVDDAPYGGGVGMLLKIEPIANCLAEIKKKTPTAHVILLTPQGKVFSQKQVPRLLKKSSELIFICGHYEGIDARVQNFVDEQISIGKFITTGGEVPALVITDSLIRAIPGVIKERSYQEDSFTGVSLDFDSFTRPREFKGMGVPEVLLSGNHQKIREWREKNAQEKKQRRKTP